MKNQPWGENLKELSQFSLLRRRLKSNLTPVHALLPKTMARVSGSLLLLTASQQPQAQIQTWGENCYHMGPWDSNVFPQEMFLLHWPHKQNLGVYPPACVMLKPRQLFLIFPKSHPSSIPAPEVMLETSSDPAKPGVRRSPRPHSHRSLCFLGVCCRKTPGQVRMWPWLSCWGTAKGHPEQEQTSSTSPSQSLPEGATRQLLWTERWRAQAGSDEINSGDGWFIA